MHHDGGWKRRASRHLFRSKWFALRQDELTLPNGEDITYTLIEHSGYAMVVPVLADGRVVMERIFRHTLQQTLLECPSGGLDGEAPEIAARRELEEETGYRAGTLAPLGSYYGSSGISTEQFHIFLATDLRSDGVVQREATEQIEIVLIPLAELQQTARRGEMEDGPSALAILLAADRLGR
ncbi:MAG TPA: NUDIX hydrolase [Candidatus Binatia bacterium]|nr:NUDIX hydrolase [Candidatus Binatia bacterium]